MQTSTISNNLLCRKDAQSFPDFKIIFFLKTFKINYISIPYLLKYF